MWLVDVAIASSKDILACLVDLMHCGVLPSLCLNRQQNLKNLQKWSAAKLLCVEGPRGAPPAVAIAMDEPPPEYSVAAHLPTYDQAEMSKGTGSATFSVMNPDSFVPDPTWFRVYSDL